FLSRELFSANLPKICRSTLRRRANSCDGSRTFPAVSRRGGNYQAHPQHLPRAFSMERTPLRIRMEASPHRNSNRRSNRIGFWQLNLALAGFVLIPAINSQLHADIPWPEVVQRLAYENDKLARRPQGHNGEYF